MFLPVLLVRDYGLAGFIAFAVPNILGAAAIGTVLATPEVSRRVVADHHTACIAFSVVTILFHAFFLSWMVRGLIGMEGFWITIALTLAMFLFNRRDRSARWLAVLIFLISIGLFVLAVTSSSEIPFERWMHSAPTLNLLGLVVVSAFGFIFCPYLDLTFHRARQANAARPGAAAFLLGFVVFFPAMIGFTLWYAPRLIPGTWNAIGPALAGLIAAHLMLQTALTVSLHARALMTRTSGGSEGRSPMLAIGVCALAITLAALPFAARELLRSEQIYRLFLYFYALPFPAYVWLCMIPRGRAAAPTQRAWITLAVAVAIATPFFWFAFLNDRMVLVFPAVALVLASRLALPRDRHLRDADFTPATQTP